MMDRVAFTICNAFYLPYALECERSFALHHQKGWSFFIFLIDHPRLPDRETSLLRQLLSSDTSQILAVSEIFSESREVSSMSLYYDVIEYSTALKPWIFSYLLSSFSPPSVTYIDPDIQFFASLSEVELAAGSCDCLVTPHVLTDSLNSVQQPTLQNIRSCGSYNFGFVHFENTKAAARVISFWKQRLIHDALICLEQNFFTDQRFGDLFPSLCNVRVSHNPGLNVAYWNLQERLLYGIPPSMPSVRLIRGDEIESTVYPLVFFHFSGLRFRGFIGISKYCGIQPRYARGGNKELEYLMDQYEAILALNRQRIQELPLVARPDLIGAVAFYTGGSQQVYQLKQQQRRDLNKFFRGYSHAHARSLPPPRFVNEESFLHSLHGLGVNSDSLIIQSALNIFEAIGLEVPGLSLQQSSPQDSDQVGERFDDEQSKAELNVVGYPNFSFGIGRVTALVLKGLADAGVRFSFVVDPANAKSVIPEDLSWVEFLPGLSRLNLDAPTLFLVNADQLIQFANTGIADHCFSRVCNLGYWWWELERPVPDHRKAAGLLDRVLAPTQFIFESLAQVVPPEKLVYAPLDYRALYEDLASDYSRFIGNGEAEESGQEFLYRLGLDLQLLRFKSLSLMVFDFHSCIERKNPWTALDIFSEPDFADHALIIKCSGGAGMAEQYVRLIEHVSKMPNVYLLDRRLSDSDLSRLFAICQIYVSPHRAEGLGLSIIEADACGLATVTTNYGGISDYPFFGPGPHLRIGYSKQPVPLSSVVYQPYIQGMGESALWAEPDRASFARGMRECFANLASRPVQHPSGFDVFQHVSCASKVDSRDGSDQSSYQSSVQLITIIPLLQSILSSEVQSVSVQGGSLSSVVRDPAAISMLPTLTNARRKLFLTALELVCSSRQSLLALKRLVNVCCLILGLLLRWLLHKALLWSFASRLCYLRRQRILASVRFPPSGRG